MAIANLTIRFIVELAGIAAFGYWGLQVGGPALAVVAVAIAIVVWAVVVAPKARNRLSQEQRDIVGTAILLLAAGLARRRRPARRRHRACRRRHPECHRPPRHRARRPRRVHRIRRLTAADPIVHLEHTTMQLAPGLHRLGDGLVNSYLVEDGGAITIVDAGMAGQYGDLERELTRMGRTKADVKAIVLTHGDTDHVGYAERLRRETGIPVYVGAADAERARGAVKKPSSGWGPMKPGPFLGFMAYGLRKGGLRTTLDHRPRDDRRRGDPRPARIAARHPAAGPHAGQRRGPRAARRGAVPRRRDHDPERADRGGRAAARAVHARPGGGARVARQARRDPGVLGAARPRGHVDPGRRGRAARDPRGRGQGAAAAGAD